MYPRAIAGTALLVCSLAFSGCEAEGDASPTPLIGSLSSRMSATAVRGALKVAEMQWEARTERSTARPGHPDYTITTVRVTSFSDMGVNGWLGLTFFNDQLMKTDFFPDDLPQYRSRLEAGKNLRFGPTDEARLPPQTKIWIGKALGAETRYVGWEDVALTEDYRKAIS